MNSFFIFLYSLAGAATLWFCRAAFRTERTFLPRKSVIPTLTWTLPRGLSEILWAFDLVLILSLFPLSLFSETGLRVGLIFQSLWGLAILFFDRFMWSPHLLHFTLISLTLSTGRKDTYPLQLFTVFLYVYGGLQKLNPSFAKRILPGFFGDFARRTFSFELETLNLSTRAWLSIPAAVTETLLGIGLLFTETRIYSLFGISMLHLSILVACGPLGSNSYHGIWGWNILCLFQPHIIFSENPLSISKLSNNLSDMDPLLWLTLILFGIPPAMNIITRGKYFERNSFKMHSLNSNWFTFLVPESTRTLNKEILPYVIASTDLESKLDFYLMEFAYYNYSMTPPMSLASAKICGQNLADILNGEVLVIELPISTFFPEGKGCLTTFIPKTLKGD